MSVKVVRDQTASFAQAIRALTKHQVLVGIPADNADRTPDPEEGDQPINNAMIGYLMENGSPAQNLPARPHVVPGIREAQDQIAKTYRDGGRAVIEGRVKDPDIIHNAVGLIAENSIKRKITNGPFAPLAPSTLAARKRKGRTGEKPLLDTGQYRRAVTHVIRPK